jgi:hypothetical protein
MSVRSHTEKLCSRSTDFFNGIWHFSSFEYMSRKFISGSVLLRIKNVSDESYGENLNSCFLFGNFFFFPENRAFCEIMLKNIVERGRPQMAMWRMRIECWIPKVTKTHSEYVILSACPLQRWLLDVPECCIIRTLPAFSLFVTGFHTNVPFCLCHLKRFEARSSVILNNGFTLQENTLGLIERYKIYVSKLCNDIQGR